MSLEIGDRVAGKVIEITAPDEANRKLKIYCDIGRPGWTCSLQFNLAVAAEARLFRVGDPVDGWVIRKHETNKFLAIGISEFGRFPPKPDTQAENLEALLQVKLCLVEAQQGRFQLPPPEAVATVKGLFNRSVKKDQWDWLYVYRAFGFKDDLEAGKTRDRFVRFSDATKDVRKERLTEADLLGVAQGMVASGFLALIDRAVEGMGHEQIAWGALKTAVPVGASKTSGEVEDFDLPEVSEESPGQVTEEDPGPSLAKSAATQVRRERANAVHQLLVRALSSVLFRRGHQPLYNALIDLYLNLQQAWYIFEMKSLSATNEVAQVRKAVSQLYEYRFLHGLKEAKLVIVVNRPLTEPWLLEYLMSDREILICWLDGDGFTFPEGSQDPIVQLCKMTPTK